MPAAHVLEAGANRAAKKRGNRCAARPGHVDRSAVEPAEFRPERGAGAGRSPGRKCCPSVAVASAVTVQ